MRSVAFALIIVLSLASGSASAQNDLRAKTQALAVIAESANSICYNVDQGGGKVNDILSGTIDKVSEKLTRERKSEQYHGVLQTELAATLKITQDCRKSVFDMLVVRMVPTVNADTGLSVSQSVHLKPRTVEQPSISCRHNNEPIEELICADADVALWDGRMGQLYFQKMKQLDARGRKRLRQSQIDWLRVRDANCKVPTAGNWSATDLAPAKPCVLQMTRSRAMALVNY